MQASPVCVSLTEYANALGCVMRDAAVVKAILNHFANRIALFNFQPVPRVIETVPFVYRSVVIDNEEEFVLFPVIMCCSNNAVCARDFDEMLELNIGVISIDADHNAPPVVNSVDID